MIYIFPIFISNHCPFSEVFSKRLLLLFTVFLLIFVDCLSAHQYLEQHILICPINRLLLPKFCRFPCHFNQTSWVTLIPTHSFPFHQLLNLYFFSKLFISRSIGFQYLIYLDFHFILKALILISFVHSKYQIRSQYLLLTAQVFSLYFITTFFIIPIYRFLLLKMAFF